MSVPLNLFKTMYSKNMKNLTKILIMISKKEFYNIDLIILHFNRTKLIFLIVTINSQDLELVVVTLTLLFSEPLSHEVDTTECIP